MRYLYGDATPFPLEGNFIDTLTELVDTCVALYQIDAAAERDRDRIAHARQSADHDLAQLSQLALALDTALVPFAKASSKAEETQHIIDETALKISEATRTTLLDAKQRVLDTRDREDRSSSNRCKKRRVEVAEHLQRLLAKHELPETRWAIEWQHDEKGPAASVVGEGKTFSVEFASAIEPDGFWARPIPVGEYSTECLNLQRTRGRRQRSVVLELRRLSVVGVVLSPMAASLVLTQVGKKRAEHYRICMWTPRSEAVTLDITDAQGDKLEEWQLVLTGTNLLAIEKIWAVLSEHSAELISTRSTLGEATFAGQVLKNLEQPREIADALLDTVSPYVHQMRMRSRVPGEFILKRDLGDNRREELFLPREVIAAKIESLDESYHRAFEAHGLGADSTREFNTRVHANHRNSPPCARRLGGIQRPQPSGMSFDDVIQSLSE